jgi:hypothetical protein
MTGGRGTLHEPARRPALNSPNSVDAGCGPRLTIWLPLLGFVLGWLLVLAAPAHASDCPPDDPSRSDCSAAASTARNPLVPIGGSVVGGVVGNVVGRGRGGSDDPTAQEPEVEDDEEDDDEEEDEEEEEDDEDDDNERKNPCQTVLERFQLAKLNQEVLMQAFLAWENTIQSLDDLYWKTSKAGYYGGVVDIGFLAGAVFGRPLAGLSEVLGKKYLNDSLRKKLLEAALKSMLKGSLKDATKYFDPAKLPGKLTEDVGKKYLQEFLKEQITTSVMQDYLEEGAIRAGGFDGATVKFMQNVKNYDKFREIVTKSYADHWANFLGDSLSMYNAGMDALTTKEQLEIIRSRLQAARQSLFATQRALDAANNEAGLARDAYQNCSQGDEYQKYLRYLEFLKLPKQG